MTVLTGVTLIGGSEVRGGKGEIRAAELAWAAFADGLDGRDDAVAMQYLIPNWTFDPSDPASPLSTRSRHE